MTTDPREQLQDALGTAYTLERELRGGGMSQLFLATERALKRPVVIKLLPREQTSELSAARFQREMELAAQLQHPHILPIYGAGARHGMLYYIMPYVPGESLRQRLDSERQLPVADALRVLREVADALAYAHHSGVIHRDIKPENILLEQGHAVLADFGIARALDEPSSGDRLTRPGMSVGTPGYMAPEQAAGEPSVDGRADVYALAVVGYEMLAGRPPFIGPTAQAILAAHLTTTPTPLADLRADTPAQVCAAIHKALAKSPMQRFRTAAEFRDALDVSLTPAVATPTLTSRAFASAASLRGLLAGAKTVLGRLRPHATAPVSPTTIAVLPFSVRGSERLSYLGDGMVDLLSTKLDGAGELCSVDPHAVLGVIAQEDQHTYDPARGRSIAARLGAGLYVLGSIVEIGGRLQLTASLYDAQGEPRSTAHATASDEAQLFELIDELAIQLLAGQVSGPSAGSSALAATTTHCLPALKAYLEGEKLFRGGQFTLAKEAFQRAVDADPLFALAWYRLSAAAEWITDRELQDYAAEQALKHSSRLPAHDRALLEAFVAWRRGSRTAEGLYRNIVGSYPNDVEAWSTLGEVLFHYGPLCGRSVSESREAWERVLDFDPSHLGALYHLAAVAAAERRLAELDELTERVVTLSPQSERTLEALALRAFALGDTAEERRVVAELRRATDAILISIVRNVALFADNLDGALSLARLVAAPSRAPEVRALGHVQVAYLEAARGRYAAARAELAEAAALDEALALPARGLLATLPFLQVPRPELDATLTALTRWDAGAVPPSASRSLFVRVHNGVHPTIRADLLGLLHARAGDYAAAHRYAAELRGLGDTPVEKRLSRALSEDVHAEIASRRGEMVTALQTLEKTTLEVGYELPLASPFYSRSHARFHCAGLLGAQGREEEAIRLYSSFEENSVYDLIYVAASHMRRGELYEKRGDRGKAVSHYRRLVVLWSQCDPDLRPMRDEAQRRFTQLGGSALEARTPAHAARGGEEEELGSADYGQPITPPIA
jgi:eukaryotic-like serine/threonine-protein kinase